MAQATVSEPDVNGVVTIATTEAGQIGQLNSWGAMIGLPLWMKMQELISSTLLV